MYLLSAHLLVCVYILKVLGCVVLLPNYLNIVVPIYIIL